MPDISLRMSRLNVSDSSAQMKSERVDDEFQPNQHPLTPEVLTALEQRFSGFDPYGPDGRLATYQGLLDRNQAALVPVPPYRLSYGPYREFKFDWFRLISWSTDVAGYRQWLYQFTLVDHPITSSFDYSKEHIKVEAIGEDGEWHEEDPTDYVMVESASHMHH